MPYKGHAAKPGTVPDTKNIVCRSFVPDVDDCETAAIAASIIAP